ncbi:MAG: type IV pilus modification protein PilV [Pseudomonas sp.]|nr:type IV pilus modification protein PilV [Pseudomonas sp.]
MKRSQGFSLIEVLVTIVLTTVGILGMVALQSKSIQYTQDAVNRNAAVTLSNDLIEIMRSHRDDLFNNTPPISYSYTELVASSDIYNASGELQLDDANCPASGLANSLQEQGDCWLKQVIETLPDASNLIAGSFRVCPSFKLDANGAPDCPGASYKGSTLAIQLAWRSKEEVCGKNSDSDICTFTTRVEL